MTDAQKQAIESRQRHAAKIKSTPSQTKLESKDAAMLSSRAYDAVYRNNGSPLKKKPNESSARKL